ncbi:hypothetical protein AB833_21845 [Chromatiales bacterium (ex Bugula neritina AB1)]|nr:hypothetical protein AB833_21845 [Chromatiales bacterium (ex Bugula neritina AB1)]
MTLSRIVPAHDSSKADVQNWQLPQFKRSVNISPLAGATTSVADLNGQTNSAPANSEHHDEEAQRGYNDGLQLAAKQSQEKIQQLDTLISALANPGLAMSGQVMEELLNLAKEIARQILLRELSISADDLPKMLQTALEQMPVGSETTIVMVNSSTADRLQQYLSEESASTLKLVINNSLNDNNITLKKGRSVLHGGLDGMLNSLTDQFEKST